MVKAPLWRRIVAGILDFITAFAGFGYLIGAASGQLTDNGFNLNGGPALLMIALVIAYFVAGRYLGGTIWQRVFRTRRRLSASP